jgi:SAM-dependent methyltransferase
MGRSETDENITVAESRFVSLDGKLAQFLCTETRGDSDEPNAAYWEENWKGVSDAELRHSLRPTTRLGTHGPFFRRHLFAGARVLEAGCGTGFWMRRLQQNGYRVTGLDYAVHSLRRSKSVVADLEMSVGNLLELPYREGVFDAYMSFGVVEHFIDGPGPILAESLRVLKPGGIILVSTPFRNATRMAAPTVERNRAEHLGLRFHQYFFTLEELQAYLVGAGFEALPDHQTYGVWRGLDEVAPSIRRHLMRIPGIGKLVHFADYLPILPARVAHMIFAVARKPS